MAPSPRQDVTPWESCSKFHSKSLRATDNQSVAQVPTRMVLNVFKHKRPREGFRSNPPPLIFFALTCHWRPRSGLSLLGRLRTVLSSPKWKSSSSPLLVLMWQKHLFWILMLADSWWMWTFNSLIEDVSTVFSPADIGCLPLFCQTFCFYAALNRLYWSTG